LENIIYQSPFKQAPMSTHSAITTVLHSVQHQLCCMYISLCCSFKWNKLQYFCWHLHIHKCILKILYQVGVFRIQFYWNNCASS